MEKLRIVSISFHTAGKIFDFDARDLELKPGDKVIVETERGRALGNIISDVREISPNEAPPKFKSVIRIAADTDLAMADSNGQRETEALKFCKQRVAERKMEMKLVRAEYLFDGSKIIFYFTADGRVDFRDLVRDLAQYFRTRIEMRQIGVRDEAKLVGGMGICGRELCCCSYLRNFAPVSVKMAKAQGLALNPVKISGQCGRLLCCLAYEYDTYNELRKNLPKCGKKVPLESGTAEVIAVDVLAQKVTVSCSNGERCSLTLDELKNGVDKCGQEKPAAAQKPAGRPQAARPAPAAKAEQSDEQQKKNKPRSRRPTGRNRSQRSGRPTEGRQDQPQTEAKPEQKKPQKPEQTQPQGQSQAEGQEQNRRKRNRRRPRRRQNRPDSPEKSS